MMIKFLRITALFFICQLNVAQADDDLPDFNFSDTEEKIHDITEWKGKTLVINFWATWCQPCLKEIPDFMALQKQYAKQNIQFIGVAIDDAAAVSRYKNAIGVNYPILVANEWEGYDLSARMGNKANTVPYTVVANSDGKIIYRYAGAVKKSDLIAIIAPKN
jgi:thiol-disulfide isomerase/thioredoxin